eukprot:TRINITY_DN5333_c0_g1_i1.p1 TRINITY_DN5333_c0_g1~~TRINITY_DN5333_c0_g1_i1.p1  ORF type:complete len:463 (+),score=141.56 TRINITY_DN5333_c0_g1_i1:55-1389(+)
MYRRSLFSLQRACFSAKYFDPSLKSGAKRVIADLRELAKLTSSPSGAQRLAWTPTWQKARSWFKGKVGEMGLTVRQDYAGNNWATLEGENKEQSIIVGSHIDCVLDGGWLDGCLGVVAGMEVLRNQQALWKGKPPVTIHCVDWADEEGSRFGRSLMGSSSALGVFDKDTLNALSKLKDKNGIRLPDALRDNGVELEQMPKASTQFEALKAKAYLELHIEQGPVLESVARSTGTVLGTVGVERHKFRFVGQAAHSGSTPTEMRRDAFLAAAEMSLECREIARRYGTVCTVGCVHVEPGIVTACPGVCEISLDQRALDANVLAKMFREAEEAADKAAQKNKCSVKRTELWCIEPRPFNPTLLKFSDEAIVEVTGVDKAYRLPSGPLHDAAEVALKVPTVMMFAQSSPGLSHCKEENTKEEDLDVTVQSFLSLVNKTVKHIGGGGAL